MKILITGSEGFIGSRLVKKLENQGHEIIHFDYKLGHNLNDLEQVENTVSQADAVFHLAAQADLTQMENIEIARDGVLTNVQGTHNIAYVCALYKKWLIYASTVCVYGNLPKEDHPAYTDKTLPNPSELYACSKYAGEWIVKGYGYNFKMPWTILRFATIYGEGMRPAMGMHIFFRQAMRGEDITVHGDGLQTRTLTYVDDLVDGMIQTLENPETAKYQVLNLTATNQISALKMAQDVKEITGSLSEIVFIPQRQNQTIYEEFDVSKTYEKIGWKSETEWHDGLAKTYEWIKTQ